MTDTTLITHDIATLSRYQEDLNAIMEKIDAILLRCNALSNDPAHREDTTTVWGLIGAAIHLRVAYASVRDACSEILAAEVAIAGRVTK